MSVRYTVNESFYTFQGEGEFMGQAAHFIRLQGCDQSCSWCDAASTWHPDWKPKGLWKGNAEETAALTDEAPRGALVVLTGGEPCLYDLDPLIAALHERGRLVNIETAGHRPVPDDPAVWVTLSPKPDATHPLPESVARANEFKVIVSDERTLREGLACIEGRDPDAPVWLHPEWSRRQDAAVIGLIVNAVKENPPTFRAGWQLHKNYMADLLDPGARKEPVPLGGTSGAPY